MSEKATTSASGGIGFFGLLTIVFITLKLTGQIDWSWWWVWLPFYGPVVFWLGILLIAGLLILIVELFD